MNRVLQTMTVAALILCHPGAVLGQPAGETDDTVIRAFRDEVKRTTTRLKVGEHPSPYFTAYTARESAFTRLFGSFGALDRIDRTRARDVKVDVRVGDYKFDNSGMGRGYFGFFQEHPDSMPLEDDYDAIRHCLWLSTDDSYKRAVEDLETKKSVLQQKTIEDLPDSMAKVDPVVSLPEVKHEPIDPRWEKDIRRLSAVFRSYPEIIESEVVYIKRRRARWFANSEGSRNREGEDGVIVLMTATAQAADGMKVSDFEFFATTSDSYLPSAGRLKSTAGELAARVTALARAPLAEDYRGPILFEGPAAAELFAQTLAPKLINKMESPFDYARGQMRKIDVGERIGRRILPAFITIVDDPLAATFQNIPLKGGYIVDDEGVRAQKVTLVEKGVLKTLCSGRTPSRHVKQSNGHWRSGTAIPSQLFVTTTKSTSYAELRKQLIDAGKDEGLKYVMVAKRLMTPFMRYITTEGLDVGSMFPAEARGALSLTDPTLLYRVSVADGQEELVRGARFEHLSERLWRDIVAAGDDTAPYPVLYPVEANDTSMSLVTPSVLVSEIDIERRSHETDTPIILKNPYFEKQSFSTTGGG